MNVLRDDAVYRESPDFVEELEGTDTCRVRAVYQVLRFQPVREDSISHAGGRLLTPHLSGVLSRQVFRVGEAWAVVIRAERPEELRAAQRAVMEMFLDGGWLVALSRYEQMTYMKQAHQAGVSAFSLPGGAP